MRNLEPKGSDWDGVACQRCRYGGRTTALSSCLASMVAEPPPCPWPREAAGHAGPTSLGRRMRIRSSWAGCAPTSCPRTTKRFTASRKDQVRNILRCGPDPRSGLSSWLQVYVSKLQSSGARVLRLTTQSRDRGVYGYKHPHHGPDIKNAAIYLGPGPVRQSVDVEVGRRCWTYPEKKKTK
jgi:hypothetical protein